MESYMASSQLERRVAALEAEVASLKNKLEEKAQTLAWWEQIAGTFKNDLIYDHAMRLGQHYRQSLRPKPSTRRKQ
jgi:hypothetical protein